MISRGDVVEFEHHGAKVRYEVTAVDRVVHALRWESIRAATDDPSPEQVTMHPGVWHDIVAMAERW